MYELLRLTDESLVRFVRDTWHAPGKKSPAFKMTSCQPTNLWEATLMCEFQEHWTLVHVRIDRLSCAQHEKTR